MARRKTAVSKKPDEYTQLVESVEELQNDNFLLQETVRDLELALNSVDWRHLTHLSRHEFSREGIRQITEIARLFFLKNPLVHRGATVQSLYVWGQGWSVRAKDESVQETIDLFLQDWQNQAELTSQQSLKQKEIEQQTDANTFLVFFTNRVTGRVRVRSIPLDEISEIFCSPDDAKEPWYYKRIWTVETFTDTGAIEVEKREAYYPDWNYKPTAKPASIGGLPVMWDTPIFHIKTGSFSNWKFGVSEIYSSIDWARAYKEFLEDFASITRAHRKFAWDLSVPGGKTSIAAAKSKLQTTVGTGANNGYDTNPAPVAASTFIRDGNTQLTPVRTAGATVGLEDGRRIALMAFAGMGLPETFFGDVSVGTLATATSLDRPTELAMRDRQIFWQDVFAKIFDYVLLQSIRATNSNIAGLGAIERIVTDGQIEESVKWSVDAHIDIDFPPVISTGLLEQVQAIVSGATLNGQQLAGTMDIVTLSRMILSALSEDDIDEIIEQQFPNGEIPEWADPAIRAERQQQMMNQSVGNNNDDTKIKSREAAAILQRKLLDLWEVSR